MPSRPDWEMMFVLPNLLLEKHHLSPPELNLGLEGIAIVPASDNRVSQIADWSEPASQFLQAFHDGNGAAITPAVLIIRSDWLRGLDHDPEPIVAFRNAAALSCILPARAQVNGGGWLGVHWSDTFDYHAAQLRPDGSRFDLWTPALNSIGYRLEDLSLTADVRLPRNHIGPIDDHLAKRLGRVWRRRYRQRRDLMATAKVFRSLEAAYEATSVGFRNYSSLQEVGLDAVDWATAVEVLASPKKGNVNKWHCLDLIGGARESREPELRQRKYRVRRPAKKGKPRRFKALNFTQWIFLHLHNARSKFVHGDKISAKLLAPFGEEVPPLLSLVSTVYRIALVAFLEQHWPWPMSTDDLASLDLLPGMDYRSHLLAAVAEQ